MVPTSGRSLVRRNLNVPVSLASNWYVSCDSLGAAPGEVDAPDTLGTFVQPVVVERDEIGLKSKRFAPEGISGLDNNLFVTGKTTGGNITLNVFDLSGKRRYKRSDIVAPGDVSLEWNGREENGNLVATGVYIVSISKNGSQILRQSVVVVR